MHKIFFSILLIFPLLVNAQMERTYIRQGNNDFNQQNFGNAEVEYQKAIDMNPQSLIANYNKGNALYKQKKFDDAINQFETTSKLGTNEISDASVFHNLGNTFMQKQDYEKAIKAYKEALKRNPSDKETKYNLAYANQKLKQSQQNQQNNQDQKDKEDKQDKKEDQKQDQNQDKNKQDQNKENQDKNNQNQNPQQLSKEQAEQILKSIEKDEKKLQEKLQKMKNQARKIKTDKDW